jgi:hypothetical protein
MRSINPLTEQDVKDFHRLDSEIKKRVPSIHAAAEAREMALMIRSRGLWRVEFETWQDYCKYRFGKSADAFRMFDYRNRQKQLQDSKPDANSQRNALRPDEPVKKHETPTQAMAKRDQSCEVFYTPPKAIEAEVIEAQTVMKPRPCPPDLREQIHDLAMLLKGLLNQGDFATCRQFRHAVALADRLDHTVQGEFFPDDFGTKSRGTLNQVKAYCLSQGLTQEDGEWFFFKCEGCGWKNNGKAIVDWQATVGAWKRVGNIFPSHKSTALNGHSKNISQAEMVLRQKELEDCQKQINSLRNSYESHQSWDQQDKQRYAVLAGRRTELKSLLGIKV